MSAQEIGKPPMARSATARHRGTLRGTRRHARDGDGQAYLKGSR